MAAIPPLTHILGFPRVGAQRELKFAQESFWRGETSEAHLRDVAQKLRRQHWDAQRAAGLNVVTVGDFAYYDQMLGMSALLGALPARFRFEPKTLTLAQYFALARGDARQPAMEMTKWFDTNYHYLVPELGANTSFDGGVGWFFDEVDEALALGHRVKPVLIGPITWLRLAKTQEAGFDRLALLPKLIERYIAILEALSERRIEWVQFDEPALCLDLENAWLEAATRSYDALGSVSDVKILLATYFGSAGEHAARVARMPIGGVHVDLIRAPRQLDAWRDALPSEKVLSVGVIDGRTSGVPIYGQPRTHCARFMPSAGSDSGSRRRARCSMFPIRSISKTNSIPS
jgi:5-methyltetrahydropteroyltriglutamate--homocysteine methyltransferase